MRKPKKEGVKEISEGDNFQEGLENRTVQSRQK